MRIEIQIIEVLKQDDRQLYQKSASYNNKVACKVGIFSHNTTIHFTFLSLGSLFQISD